MVVLAVSVDKSISSELRVADAARLVCIVLSPSGVTNTTHEPVDS